MAPNTSTEAEWKVPLRSAAEWYSCSLAARLCSISSRQEATCAGSATLLSGNLLEVSENGSIYNLQFDPGQVFSGSFQLSDDGSGGTDIAFQPDNRAPIAVPDTNSIQAGLSLTRLGGEFQVNT